jgi:hypothetical protein
MTTSKQPVPKHRRTRLSMRTACAWALIHVVGHAAWATSAAPASPKDHVYRCRQDNSVAYSQLPCAPEAERIKASDPRTASQQKQSLANDRQEARLAAQMTRIRRHEERVAADDHAQALTRAARTHHAQIQPVASPGSVTPLPKAGSNDSNGTNNTTYKPHRHRHFKAVVPKASPMSQANTPSS